MHLDRPLPWERPALASGILFTIGQLAATAYFIVQIAPNLPPLTAPAADHVAFYTSYARENVIVAFLYLLPVPFFLLFVGGLFGVLRRVERGVGVLTATALGAGMALSIVWPIGIVVSDAGQAMAAGGLQPAAVLAFDSVAQLMLALSALPQAVMLATSALALRASTAPRWISWCALGLAALGLLGSATLLDASVYPILALSNLLFALWVGAAGVIFLRRAPAENPAVLAQAAAAIA